MPVEGYTHRLIRGLERQASLSSAFAPRLALQEAKLAILARLAETLANPTTTETVLDELLHHLLDAAGISHGLAYLREADGRLSLRSHVGYGDEARIRCGSSSATPAYYLRRWRREPRDRSCPPPDE